MKKVLITGVNGGIGKAAAKLFNESGWCVLGVDCVGIDKSIGLANFWQGDVSQESFWQDIAENKGLGQGLDALVNNAAIQLNKGLLETTVEEWHDVLNVNLTASFLSTKYMTPYLEGRKSSIVNVSSVHALQTSTSIAAYAVSKAGLNALTRASALELAEKSIRVNAILPGAVDTRMLEDGLCRGHLQAGDLGAMKDELAQKTPCGRVGQADEIAKAIFFLSDNDSASFITGQTLVVDGGALAKLSTE